jgi:hypothetical protein
MRRLLDPRQLEALAREEDSPSLTPMEKIQAAMRHFLVLFVIAVSILLAAALSLAGVPGVVP